MLLCQTTGSIGSSIGQTTHKTGFAYAEDKLRRHSAKFLRNKWKSRIKFNILADPLNLLIHFSILFGGSNQAKCCEDLERNTSLKVNIFYHTQVESLEQD
jgi:hypothetical protein